MRITIVETSKGNGPTGKVADAELEFTTGLLAGLKLIGFGIWERRTGNGHNVTFPARQYAVNGERRSFALLRPAGGDIAAQEPVRAAILEAYDQFFVYGRKVTTFDANGRRQAAQTGPTLSVSPAAQATIAALASDLETRHQAAAAQVTGPAAIPARHTAISPALAAQAQPTAAEHIATHAGPVSTRTIGTAGDYGSRGTAPDFATDHDARQAEQPTDQGFDF